MGSPGSWPGLGQLPLFWDWSGCPGKGVGAAGTGTEGFLCGQAWGWWAGLPAALCLLLEWWAPSLWRLCGPGWRQPGSWTGHQGMHGPGPAGLLLQGRALGRDSLPCLVTQGEFPASPPDPLRGQREVLVCVLGSSGSFWAECSDCWPCSPSGASRSPGCRCWAPATCWGPAWRFPPWSLPHPQHTGLGLPMLVRAEWVGLALPPFWLSQYPGAASSLPPGPRLGWVRSARQGLPAPSGREAPGFVSFACRWLRGSSGFVPASESQSCKSGGTGVGKGQLACRVDTVAGPGVQAGPLRTGVPSVGLCPQDRGP